MKIAITGASGSQQAPVVEALLVAGHEVVALSRTPRSARPGLTWIEGEATDPGVLTRLLDGADALSLHVPVANPQWPATTVVAAAAEHGVRRLVFNAGGRIPGPEEPPATSRAVVEAMRAHGLPFVALQPTLYLENLLLPPVIRSLRDGVLSYPLPASGFRVAWVATADVAALTVAALSADEPGSIFARGPDALDGDGLAAALGEGLGRPLRYVQAEPSEFGATIAPIIGDASARMVEGLYAGINASPDVFKPWLEPDSDRPRWASEHRGTSVAQWAAATLRHALAEPSQT